MSAPAQRTKSLFRVLISLLVLLGALLIFQNRQYLQDQVVAWQYQPSPEMTAVIDGTSLSEEGRFLIAASRSELLPRDAFNNACRSVMSEQTAVLGCYTNNRIHLFDIDDKRLDGIKEVTAAHEMLHAAYQRLSVAERQRIDGLLEKQSLGSEEQRIGELMAEYAKSEPGERLNELHSIVGSELGSLSPELETYYAQYFSDRQALVALSKQYQSVFAELQSRQEALVSELTAIADSIDRKGSVYKRDQQVLTNDIKDFNGRASNGEMTREQYSAERAELERRQSSLRFLYDELQTLIDTYEQKRSALAAINSESNALNRSINSSLNPVPEVN